MTKFDNKFVPSIPKTYTVSELRDTQQPVKKSNLSVVARSKIINRSGSNYLSENQGGYGPCKNTLCGCSCSSETCKCGSSEVSIYNKGGFSVENYSASGKLSSDKLSGQYSHSTFRVNDWSGDAKFLSGTVGGKIDTEGIGVKASVDLANVKSDGVQVRTGVSVDTGITLEEGVKEVKILGTGVSVDENQIGFSTPFFEIKWNYR